jgi:hypothetical protein
MTLSIDCRLRFAFIFQLVCIVCLVLLIISKMTRTAGEYEYDTEDEYRKKMHYFMAWGYAIGNEEDTTETATEEALDQKTVSDGI